MGKGHTYADAGVDIEADDRAISSLSRWLERTQQFRPEEIFSEVKGHYSGLYRLGGGRVLSMSTDGVGTKLMVAHQLRRYDTVGIDLLGMLANDIIAVGSTPVAMVDYIGVEKTDEGMLEEIGKGIYEGCSQSGVVVVGGETATLPGIIKGFDLAGAIVGLSSEGDLVLGNEISDGDVLIGLESTGLHSNGYTLARKALFEWGDLTIYDTLPTDPSTTVGEALMVPTRIYVKLILDILSRVRPHGLAHITGGGLTKLRRLRKGVGYTIDSQFPVQPIFEAVRKLGKVDLPEMHRTFNMGTGFIVIVEPRDRDEVLESCESFGIVAKPIGTAAADPAATITVRGREKFLL